MEISIPRWPLGRCKLIIPSEVKHLLQHFRITFSKIVIIATTMKNQWFFFFTTLHHSDFFMRLHNFSFCQRVPKSPSIVPFFIILIICLLTTLFPEFPWEKRVNQLAEIIFRQQLSPPSLSRCITVFQKLLWHEFFCANLHYLFSLMENQKNLISFNLFILKKRTNANKEWFFYKIFMFNFGH